MQTNYLINETDKLLEPRFWGNFEGVALGNLTRLDGVWGIFTRLHCFLSFFSENLDLGILIIHTETKQRRANFFSARSTAGLEVRKEGVMIEWRVEGMSDDRINEWWKGGVTTGCGVVAMSEWLMEKKRDGWVNDGSESL